VRHSRLSSTPPRTVAVNVADVALVLAPEGPLNLLDHERPPFVSGETAVLDASGTFHEGDDHTRPAGGGCPSNMTVAISSGAYTNPRAPTSRHHVSDTRGEPSTTDPPGRRCVS
jgi:hypothetical protein